MYTRKRLIAISLALYAVCLFLPAVGGQIGLSILYVGIVYGWFALIAGWVAVLAVYANVFYWWTAIHLLRGKRPEVAALLSMVFASFTLLLVLMPGPEYVAVGWGALLWLAALRLMQMVVFGENTPEALRQSFKKWAKTCAAVTLALFAFGRWQYAAANAQQREQYFPFGTVFAFMLPSSLPYIAPPQSLHEPNNGTAEWLGGLEISQDNSLILVSGSLKEYTPPKRFIYQGYLIQEYFHEDGILSIVPAPAPADYRYGYRPAKEGEQGEQGEQIQFIQKADGQTVWQAPVKADELGQYPEYDKEIKRLWQPPLYTEIAAGFKANPVQTFTEACPIEPYSAPFKLHEPLQIAGKIYSDKYRSPVAKSRILCNSEYILWLNAPEYQDYNGRVDLSAVLIRRSDMLPVEEFKTSREKGWTNYDELKQASEQPQAWLASIGRMETRRRDENGYGYDDYELVVHSSNGE